MEFRILCDLDGVIYDWIGDAIPHLGIDVNNSALNHILKTEHDAPEIICGKEKLNKIISSLGPSFWENLQLFPWALSLYQNLSKIAPVYFLTSPGNWLDAGKGKAMALLRDFEVKSFILLKNKEVVAAPNNILIDDKPSNVMKFRENGGWGYLWPNSYKIGLGEIHLDNTMENCLDYVTLCKHYYDDWIRNDENPYKMIRAYRDKKCLAEIRHEKFA